MIDEIRRQVAAIHDTPQQAVIAVSGAGTAAVAWLLGVGGASRTILEVAVPYGRQAMQEFLGFEPEQSAAAATARQLARQCYRKARRQIDADRDADRDTAGDYPAVGLACAAAIATDRPRQGEHRAYIAAWDAAAVTTYSLRLHKGLRGRAGEEELVSRLLLRALADACGLEADAGAGPALADGDELAVERTPHAAPLAQLLSGAARWVVADGGGALAVEGAVPGALLPGSFNPLHPGHRELRAAAAEILGFPPAYELSAANVDKPPLPASELRRRLSAFGSGETVALTAAATFHQKAELFPGRAFIIGWDTAVRLVAPRYYAGSGGDRAGRATANKLDGETAMLAALARMWAGGSQFLVAGRLDAGRFKTLDDVAVPAGFRPMFRAIPESLFRRDLSSTDLRGGA